MSCEVINPTAALPELGTRIRHMITTHVVNNGEQHDTNGRLFRCCFREVPRLVERLNNGAVAIDRDQHDEPDGHGLCDGRARPNIRIHVRVDSFQIRYPVSARAQRLERLYEETRHKIQVVCDRQRL